ncbi:MULTISPECIES: sensor histidine kinase KdpD [Corallococcus]|uniref:sensor histidine kinase n=1 Tax=Corallococcus sp. AB049A TaxID=2316721 RepID=UPI0026C3BCD9|nr:MULTISPECIES: HAMP domain-containing sensor histidine kinase [Corallococcus]
MVETLLDVSQLASGPVSLNVEDVDLSALVTEEVAQLREEVSREGSEVLLRIAGPVRGRFDRARLAQVVQGRLSNALKYGPGKPVEVHVEQVGPCARLTVEAHGGSVGVSETPGGGATFTVSLPLAGPKA